MNTNLVNIGENCYCKTKPITEFALIIVLQLLGFICISLLASLSMFNKTLFLYYLVLKSLHLLLKMILNTD